MMTITITIISVGVECRDAFIPTLGSSQAYMYVHPSVHPSVCPSVCLSVCPSARQSVRLSVRPSVSLSGCPRWFLAIICASCNCVQRIRPQSTRSNPLSGSVIYPSIHLSGRLRAFFGFFICINFQCGGPASLCVYYILITIRYTGHVQGLVVYLIEQVYLILSTTNTSTILHT